VELSDNEIMRDFDEDKYIEKYCMKVNCSKCNGTGEDGEPNGYGCEGNDDYVDKWYNSILKRRRKKLTNKH